MRHYKRANIFKASNVTFDPDACRAYSYGWWIFVAKIKGKVIFNSYRYSNSTSKHQTKVRGLLNTLGIKIDRHVQISGGLQNILSIKELNSLEKKTLQRLAENEEAKRIRRNEKACFRRLAKKLENYLENDVHFRDYEIRPRAQFGKYNVAKTVHQVVDIETLENDVQDALHHFHRDGFSSIVFYVGKA